MPNYKRLFALLTVSIVSTLAAMGITHNVNFLYSLEKWTEDFRIAGLTPHRNSANTPETEILILAITEETLSNFEYRSPVDRGFIVRMINKLNAAGAKAIGLDILFDQSTEPAKDAALREVLENIETPLVAAFAEEDERLTASQADYIANFIPSQNRGMANLIKVGDGSVVRWSYPGKHTRDGEWTPSFSHAIAEKLGVTINRNPARIAWRISPSGEDAFKIFPAAAIDYLPDDWFQDKIVLIGAMLPAIDRHRTPFVTTRGMEGEIPGVLIHAHILDQILNQRSINTAGPVVSTFSVFILTLVAAFLASANFSMTTLTGIFTACIALVWGAGFAIYTYYGTLSPIISPTFGLTFAFWSTEAYFRREEWSKRKLIRKLFSLYVSEALVSHLLAHPDEVNLGGERRTMSYLFTDIADFTGTAENADPIQLAILLNAYLDGICKVIIKHGGMVNDFIGDAVFAVFNAPALHEDHADLAIKCGREIDAFSEQFRKSSLGQDFQLGITRIGIHTGSAAIGNMGSSKRLKYTPIGDAVNTASRIEGLNKYLGTKICVSEETVRHSTDTAVRPIGEFRLKGRKKPLKIFELLSENHTDPGELKDYHTAYDSLCNGHEDTQRLFEELLIRNPHDPVIKFHLERLKEGPCDAVITMQAK